MASDNSDPVMWVNIIQYHHKHSNDPDKPDDTIISRHDLKYDPEPHEPLWYTGERLLPTGFYYWDETWGSCYGPFEDEEECRASLAVYCESIK